MNRYPVLATVFLGIVLPSVTFAQDSVPLPVEGALKVRTFPQYLPPRLSPNSKMLAYTVKDHSRTRSSGSGLDTYLRTGIPGWGIGTDIFVTDVTSGESRDITQGVGDNWLPSWSPDGRTLAFLSSREQGKAKLWIWDSVRNQLHKVSDIDIRAGGNDIIWTPDSLRIIVPVAPEQPVAKATPETQIKRDDVSDKPPDSTVVIYDSGASSSGAKKEVVSDAFSVKAMLRDLVVVDVTDGSYRPLVRGEKIFQYRISPNGSQIAYTTGKRFEKPGLQQIIFDLAVVDTGGNANRILASDIRLDINGEGFNWSPDGSRLAFRTDGLGERAFDCFVVRADGGGARNVSGFPISVAALTKYAGIPFWDAKGANVYFRRGGALWRAAAEGSKAEKVAEIPNRTIERIIVRPDSAVFTSADQQAIVLTHDDSGKQDGFYNIDLKRGTSSKLIENGQCYTCVDIHEWQFGEATPGGQFAFFVEDAHQSADVWFSDPSFRSFRRLTHLNPQFDAVSMGAARLIEWRGDDGASLKGALLLPSNYKNGERYPLLVWVYGGSFLSNEFDRFGLAGEGPFNMQIFATRGYAVLLPDAPQHLGTPMTDLAKTVLPGVNKVIDMGIADPDQLGVMGQSWGSYSTLSLIVQTKRFKAAVALDGMSNLISGYAEMNPDGTAFGVAHLETGQGLMGGTPWQFRERYIDNSPFFYLDRVETPLLMVHGADDRTVASFLSDETFVGLRRLGKEVQYAKYLGEDHSPVYWRYANQLDLANRMIAWFDQHLRTQEKNKGSSN